MSRYRKTFTDALKEVYKVNEVSDDHEISMARGELEAIADKATQLASMLQSKSDEGNPLEAWVQSKITKAKDYINSVSDYMMYNPDMKQNESLEEGFSSTLKQKAKEIAKKFAGNMTKAYNEIEKLAKGLSDEPEVYKVLRQYNEDTKGRPSPANPTGKDLEEATSHTVRYTDPKNKKRFAVPFKTHDAAEKKMAQLKKDGVKDIKITMDKLKPGINFKEEYIMEKTYDEKDIDKFHTGLDKLVHKHFGHSSDEKKEKEKMKKEEVELDEFTTKQIKALQTAYGMLKGKTISPEKENALSKQLDKMDLISLRQLVKANIPFVSTVAKNKVYKKTGKFEELDESSKIMNYLKQTYASMKDINPEQAKTLRRFLEKLPKDHLRDLVKNNIKFVTPIARNILGEENLEEGIKPYVSGSGGKYHVLDKDGKTVYTSTDINVANAYLKKNYDKLKEEIEKEYFSQPRTLGKSGYGTAHPLHPANKKSMYDKIKKMLQKKEKNEDLEEGKISDIFKANKEGESADEIAKRLKMSVSKVKDILGEAKDDIPPIDKENKPGVKIAKIRAMKDDEKEKETESKEKEIENLKNQNTILKQKLENEKNKVIKPEPNPETGEVPLTIGIAHAEFKKQKDKEIKEEMRLRVEAIAGLKKKADKSGMPYSILKKVYDRGMAAWKSGHRPGASQQQWAFARVNSFITKSSGTWGGADKDLAAKVKGSK